MKKKLFLTRMFIAVICALLMQTQTLAAESLDKSVATVNDAVITQSELNDAIHNVKNQMARNNAPIPPANVLHKQVLDQIINKKLQMQLAEQAGITVTDEDVNSALTNIAEQNKVSLNDVYKKAAEEGMTQSAYRKEVHDEILLQKFEQKEVGEKIVITPQEVDSFMHSKSWQASNTKEYHLEDILTALPEAPTPEQVAEAKKHAEEIMARIRGSKNFSADATTEGSKDNTVQNSDLGWRKLPEIPSAFAEQLLNLKNGEIMGPIQTPNGFHIVHVAGIRQIGNAATAAEQRQQVQQLIYQRKFEEAMQTWIKRLRSGATINMHPDSYV